MEVLLPPIGSYLRPAMILVCGMLLFNLPTMIYKSQMYLRGMAYLIFCNDKSWIVPSDPNVVVGPLLDEPSRIERKTIYFLRQGGSTWNNTFDNGNSSTARALSFGFLIGLVKAMLYELYLILSGKLDSWFYDAPLSNVGLQHGQELSRFLQKITASEKENFHRSILNAEPGSPASKLICSNLRRAVSTLAAAFHDRLGRRPQEKILIIPALQEISRNPDTLSITPAHTQILASWIDKTSKICDFQDIYTNQVDMSLHNGNKPINTNGLKRMNLFCDFLFSPSVTEEFAIIGGHACWFQSFFQTFLPHGVEHDSKRSTLVCGGVVAFDLLKASTKQGPMYMIDPKSIAVIYGGFQNKKTD